MFVSLNNSVKDYSKPSYTIQTRNLSATTVTIYGDMFQFKTLNGLYLSSSNLSMPSTAFDLYSNVKSISARYPTVYGFPVLEYDVLDAGNILQFKLPENLLVGNYDILYFNGAGYYKASQTSRFTYFTIISALPSSPTVTPTNTVTPSITPTNTVTPTNTPEVTSSPTPTITPTITQTPTVTITPTSSPIPIPSQLFYAWYDASDSSTVTTSVNNVTEWRDKSGSNNHLTPPTAIYPTYNTRTHNGLNVVDFPTQGAYIKKTSATIQNNNQTWFIVCQVDNTYGNGSSILSFNTLDSGPSSWQIYAYDNLCFVGALLRGIGGTSMSIEYQPPRPIGSCLNGTYHMFEIVFDRSSQTTSTYLDGVLKNTKSDTLPFILNGGEIKLFSNRASSQFCTGAIAEIICLGNINSTDRANVQGYLIQKWLI